MPQIRHKPVLVSEIVKIFSPSPGMVFIDATVGDGGHSQSILEKCKEARIIGIDKDPNAIERTKEFLNSFSDNIILYNLNYIDIDKVSECEVDGIVFDLGLSLYQLFDGKRGFSFLRDSPLDMGMNGSSRSVRELINKMSEDEIADVIYKYGEERFSKKIASLIVKERQIKQIDTTGELVRIIKKAYPTGYKRIHPATRTFQALRIWANDELTNLENALSKAIKLLRVGGVLLIISYHSLEDRIVKRIFKEMEVCGRYKVITKKPIRPTREEVYLNRRARSAKLRGLRRIM